jgi:hypothetical protein
LNLGKNIAGQSNSFRGHRVNVHRTAANPLSPALFISTAVPLAVRRVHTSDDLSKGFTMENLNRIGESRVKRTPELGAGKKQRNGKEAA